MVAEIWASVISSFVDQLVALNQLLFSLVYNPEYLVLMILSYVHTNFFYNYRLEMFKV